MQQIHLRVLAKWLKEAEDFSDIHDSDIEKAVQRSKQETKHEIADMIEEIMDKTDRDLLHELELSPAAQIVFEIKRDMMRTEDKSRAIFSKPFLQEINNARTIHELRTIFNNHNLQDILDAKMRELDI